MFQDSMEERVEEHFEISVRFRELIERRIARLESDAAHDESVAISLENGDHILRQMRLVAVQRGEADRMKRFLRNSTTRLSSV